MSAAVVASAEADGESGDCCTGLPRKNDEDEEEVLSLSFPLSSPKRNSLEQGESARRTERSRVREDTAPA